MSSVPKVLAVIPTRGGSTGVPNKNLLTIAGKTMLERSLAYLRKSQFDMDIIAVTNDPLCKQEALAAGLKVVDEPEGLAHQDVCSSFAVQYAAKYAMKYFDMRPDCILEHEINIPVRPPGVVDQAIEMFRDSSPTPNAVVTFNKCRNEHHPMLLWTLDKDNRGWKAFDVTAESRQLAGDYHLINSVVLLYETESLLGHNPSSRIVSPYSTMDRVMGFDVGEYVEIDTWDDVRRAEEHFDLGNRPYRINPANYI